MIRFQTLNSLISQTSSIAKPDGFSGGTELAGIAGMRGGIGMDFPSNTRGSQGQSGRYGLSVPMLD